MCIKNQHKIVKMDNAMLSISILLKHVKLNFGLLTQK